jgi:hypothetical protein
MSDYDAKIISVVTEDGKMGFSTTEFHKQQLKEKADEMNMSLSAACRYWISAGVKLHTELDPRENEIAEPEHSEDDPLGMLIEQEIPTGGENSEDMEAVIQRIQEEVEDEFLDYVEESSTINRDKWEVYK